MKKSQYQTVLLDRKAYATVSSIQQTKSQQNTTQKIKYEYHWYHQYLTHTMITWLLARGQKQTMLVATRMLKVKRTEYIRQIIQFSAMDSKQG